MISTLIKGTLAGTLVLFAWNMASWMGLSDLHRSAFVRFGDEAAVAKVVAAQAPVSGVYLLPNFMAAVAAAPADQKKAVEEKMQAAMKAGPTAFVVVHKDGMDMKAAMVPMMGRALVIGAVASLLVTWILLQAGGAGFVTRFLIALFAGAGGAVAMACSEMNWWWFSDAYTRVTLIDSAAGWALTGVVLAALTGKKKGKR